jgi:DNA topoisomerase-1
MDKQLPANGHVEPGISIRMGPVDDMDVGMVNGKRKSRGSIATTSYKERSGSEDEDDKPLVGHR